MKLFIVRHGEAEPVVRTDAERALTRRGRHDAQALGKLLAAGQVQWDAIIVSPYLRAQQTLEMLLQSFPVHPPVTVNHTITPDNAVAEAFAALEGFSGQQTILMVSHMPLVSALVASLVSGSPHDALHYPMPTASFAELDVSAWHPGGAGLKRLICPPYNA